MANYLKVGVETTFGTHVTTGGIKASSSADDIDRDLIVEENIDNDLAENGYAGTLKISGTAEGNIRPKQFGAFLEACLGAPSGGVYTLGAPKSLSMDIGETIFNQEIQYTGVGISKISMKFTAKDFATFTADWFARDFTIASFATPTVAAEDPVLFYNASVTFAGTASTEIKEITLDIDRKLDDSNFVLNDFKLHRLAKTGVTDIGGSITFSEIESPEFKRAITGTNTGTAVDANNTLGRVAMTIVCTDLAGATKMTVNCPVTLYGKGGRKIDRVSEVEKTVDYKIVGTGFNITVAA